MNDVNWLSCNGRNPVTFSGTSFVKAIIYHHYFILEFLYMYEGLQILWLVYSAMYSKETNFL